VRPNTAARRDFDPANVGSGSFASDEYSACSDRMSASVPKADKQYAARKKWTLEQVIVRLRHERVHADDCANCEDPKSRIDRILCSIELAGPLDEAPRKQLIEIAKKCPVHRTLINKIEIRTDLVAF